MQKSIIYHFAFQMVEESAGSQVHLHQMLRAFEALGYRVELVTGLPIARQSAIRRIQADSARGRNFDFLYVWSPTSPSLYPKRNLLHPFLDCRFFAWCKGQSIPRGLFYGDVHWKFDHFRRSVPWARRMNMLPLYWYDWFVYRRYMQHLFLPSLGMRTFLPTRWPQGRTSALPPGCNLVPISESRAAESAGQPLRLLYVGGVVPPLYDLKPMLDLVESVEGVQMTLCCRVEEWERVRSHYALAASSKIEIVHKSGSALAQYYAQSDLFGLYWRHPYLDFAMPVKLFESIGYGLPLLASDGTEAARFIAREGAGWLASTAEEFGNLLAHLRDNRQEIAQVRRHIIDDVRPRHTWQARAKTVAHALEAYAGERG